MNFEDFLHDIIIYVQCLFVQHARVIANAIFTIDSAKLVMVSSVIVKSKDNFTQESNFEKLRKLSVCFARFSLRTPFLEREHLHNDATFSLVDIRHLHYDYALRARLAEQKRKLPLEERNLSAFSLATMADALCK